MSTVRRACSLTRHNPSGQSGRSFVCWGVKNGLARIILGGAVTNLKKLLNVKIGRTARRRRRWLWRERERERERSLFR